MAQTIIATDGTNTLLRNGKAAIIGKIYHMGKRLRQDGTAPVSITVEFDFEEDGKIDRFFFEEGKLIYNCITLGDKPRGIQEAYAECLKIKEPIAIREFLNVVTSVYLATQMGLI